MSLAATPPLSNDVPVALGEEEDVKFYEKTSFKVGVVVATIFLALLSLVILPYAIKGTATVVILTAGAFVAFFKSCVGVLGGGDTDSIPPPSHRSGSPSYPYRHRVGGGGRPPPALYGGRGGGLAAGGPPPPPQTAQGFIAGDPEYSPAGGVWAASWNGQSTSGGPPPPPASGRPWRGDPDWKPIGAVDMTVGSHRVGSR